MEIFQQQHEDRLELQLKGRFDANWADHVAKTIESAIRTGNHQIDLDFDQVTYISSAGIRVLVKYFKQLDSVRGALRVVRPTGAVLSALQLSGLAAMLAPGSASPGSAGISARETRGQDARAPRTAPPPTETQTWNRNGVKFESYDLGGEQPLVCVLHGQPEKFDAGQLSASDSVQLRLGPESFGIGLAAFGAESDDARDRFGEFLAIGGAAIIQPTDGSSVPDFQVMEAQFLPEINLLYGLTAAGPFARLLRFEAGQSDRRVIALAELVEAALENLPAASAGFVVLAESAGVVGATLRQSPVLAAGQAPWTFPGIRDWLSFTTERSDERQVAVIAGFAQRQPAPDSAPFLRRIGSGTSAQGHFHAAVFPYRPLPKGNLGLKESITSLLATESARTVMHLLADEREFDGVGQTDLVRGACWVGPLKIATGAAKT
ncbi:MAG: hypothetical protein C5B50_08805 [Verrucomicrobia bacterium]|nr:MAG: hypothetical protein C5B50_08805 [Verrucomicrobiota bacterium]